MEYEISLLMVQQIQCTCIIHFACSLYFSMHLRAQKKYYAAHKIEARTLDYVFKPLEVYTVVVCFLCW